MRLFHICFVVSAFAGVVGVSLGIVIGLRQDFVLAPAHAHLNLLGWVTVSLYGLYHRATGDNSWLAWVQVACGALGFPLFSGGLAVYLATGSHDLDSLAIAGALACLAGIILFLIIVIRDALRYEARGQANPPAPMLPASADQGGDQRPKSPAVNLPANNSRS
jgi:hypothetical protein